MDREEVTEIFYRLSCRMLTIACAAFENDFVRLFAKDMVGVSAKTKALLRCRCILLGELQEAMVGPEALKRTLCEEQWDYALKEIGRVNEKINMSFRDTASKVQSPALMGPAMIRWLGNRLETTIVELIWDSVNAFVLKGVYVLPPEFGLAFKAELEDLHTPYENDEQEYGTEFEDTNTRRHDVELEYDEKLKNVRRMHRRPESFPAGHAGGFLSRRRASKSAVSVRQFGAPLNSRPLNAPKAPSKPTLVHWTNEDSEFHFSESSTDLLTTMISKDQYNEEKTTGKDMLGLPKIDEANSSPSANEARRPASNQNSEDQSGSRNQEADVIPGPFNKIAGPFNNRQVLNMSQNVLQTQDEKPLRRSVMLPVLPPTMDPGMDAPAFEWTIHHGKDSEKHYERQRALSAMPVFKKRPATCAPTIDRRNPAKLQLSSDVLGGVGMIRGHSCTTVAFDEQYKQGALRQGALKPSALECLTHTFLLRTVSSAGSHRYDGRRQVSGAPLYALYPFTPHVSRPSTASSKKPSSSIDRELDLNGITRHIEREEHRPHMLKNSQYDSLLSQKVISRETGDHIRAWGDDKEENQ